MQWRRLRRARVRDVWTNYGALRGARDENTALKHQLAELEIRLQEQRALAGRTTKLQELLDLKQNTDLPTVAAEVIAGKPNPGVMQITIGRERPTAFRRTWR